MFFHVHERFSFISIALAESYQSVAAQGYPPFNPPRFPAVGVHRVDCVWRRYKHLMGGMAAMAEFVYSASERILPSIWRKYVSVIFLRYTKYQNKSRDFTAMYLSARSLACSVLWLCSPVLVLPRVIIYLGPAFCQ